MIREQKVTLVEQMNARFLASPHVILARFSGVSVNQVNQLRAKVDEIGGQYTVIKNRLAKRAAEGTPVAQLCDQFSGPCALASHASDPVGLAKVLAEFSKTNPQVEMLAALVDAADLVDAAGVEALSKLPGLPELQAQLLALIQTPAQTLVRLLGTPGTQLARVLDAHREAQGGAPAPGDDGPAEADAAAGGEQASGSDDAVGSDEAGGSDEAKPGDETKGDGEAADGGSEG